MPLLIEQSVPLAPHTTLNVGGKASYFARIESKEKLQEVLKWARTKTLPVFVLGQGSNVLISDSDVEGLVLLIDIRGVSSEIKGNTTHFHVGGGEDWDTFVHTVAEAGYWGLENLSGIPGSVGASPVQNINAYGVSVSELIFSLRAYHRKTGKEETFKGKECNFSYRDSFFKHGEGKEYIITEVTFSLRKTMEQKTAYRSASQSIQSYLNEVGIRKPEPRHIREAVLRARKNIGMLTGMYQSAGSFFKNTIVDAETFAHIERVVRETYEEKNRAFAPWHWELPNGQVKVSTAFLMECTPYNKTDYKDMRFEGTVGLSPLHTLSIVNYGGATAAQIKTFASRIALEVEKIFSVRIEPEVCYLP